VLVTLAAVAAAALVAAVASADDGGRKGDDDQGRNGRGDDAAKIFSATLVGSQLADPAIHGTPPRVTP